MRQAYETKNSNEFKQLLDQNAELNQEIYILRKKNDHLTEVTDYYYRLI